jgi:hypothetical protein
MDPVAPHPASPSHRVASPSSASPRRAQMACTRRMHNAAIKDVPEQPLPDSPTQRWFDQFHARVDSVASSTAGSIKWRYRPSPRSPREDDSRSRKISYTSMSVALSTSVTDLEKRHEQRYGQRVVENYEPRRGAVYLETPSPQTSKMVAGVQYVAVANPS